MTTRSKEHLNLSCYCFFNFSELRALIIAGNDNPHAIANTKRKTYNQVKMAVVASLQPSNLDQEIACHQDVRSIIELLENIRQQDGKGKA